VPIVTAPRATPFVIISPGFEESNSGSKSEVRPTIIPNRAPPIAPLPSPLLTFPYLLHLIRSIFFESMVIMFVVSKLKLSIKLMDVPLTLYKYPLITPDLSMGLTHIL